MQLSGTGIWSGQLRYGDAGVITEAAAELDELGYAAIWIPDVGGDVLGAVELLLGATPRAVIATGILNVWMHEPADVAGQRASWTEAWQRRFLLGLGVSHQVLIDHNNPGRYAKPYSKMVEYLDAMDSAIFMAVGPAERPATVLAALGPKMLKLAGERTAGAHPYFVPVEHTAQAREILGPDPMLAPEQMVVLETDRTKALEIARQGMAIYLRAPNYVNNLARFGFGEADVADASERLVDAIVATGGVDAAVDRVKAHFDAGASHVCVQVLGASLTDVPESGWRDLAAAVNELN